MQAWPPPPDWPAWGGRTGAWSAGPPGQQPIHGPGRAARGSRLPGEGGPPESVRRSRPLDRARRVGNVRGDPPAVARPRRPAFPVGGAAARPASAGDGSLHARPGRLAVRWRPIAARRAHDHVVVQESNPLVSWAGAAPFRAAAGPRLPVVTIPSGPPGPAEDGWQWVRGLSGDRRASTAAGAAARPTQPGASRPPSRQRRPASGSRPWSWASARTRFHRVPHGVLVAG